MSGETTIYFKDLDGVVVTCHERQEFDDFHDTVWVYDIVVKAQARVGIIINYILSRDLYRGKFKKALSDLIVVIRNAVRNAISRLESFKTKLADDAAKLHELFNEFKKGELSYGTRI